MESETVIELLSQYLHVPIAYTIGICMDARVLNFRRAGETICSIVHSHFQALTL